MRQVTLRLPPEAYGRLLKLSADAGISIRSIYEASVMIALEMDRDPETSLALWELARELGNSDEFLALPRQQVVVRMDPDLFARFKSACLQHGISQNAALSLVTMPWPADAPLRGTVERHWPADAPSQGTVKRQLIKLARRLDFERRR